MDADKMVKAAARQHRKNLFKISGGCPHRDAATAALLEHNQDGEAALAALTLQASADSATDM
jgi:hypothetical protein